MLNQPKRMDFRLTVAAEIPQAQNLVEAMHLIEKQIKATPGLKSIRVKDRHATLWPSEASDSPDPVLKLDEVLEYLSPGQCGPLLGVEFPESGVHDIIRLLQEVRTWCLIAAHAPHNHGRGSHG